MGVQVCSIASGSNGNCYYVGNENEAILIDAGVSCREIEMRMKRSGLSIQKIKAVFVSHEHTDHISGLPVFAKKYNLPIFITPATLRFSKLRFEKTLLHQFSANEPVIIGDLVVTAFSKFHDAADPYSFTVSHDSINIAVITDIGRVCENVVHHFSRCHAAFLESNYDDEMLASGSYPIYLKNRIRSGHGHLSNKQALALFQKHRSPSLSLLILTHLSHNNNNPQLVEELFAAHANGVKTVVASRHRETEVYQINALSKIVLKEAETGNRQQELPFLFG